jgi:hypothetical protein
MNSNLLSKRRALYICPGWSVWSSVINELESKYFFEPLAVISHNTEFMKKSINNKNCLSIDEQKMREGRSNEENNYALDENILKLIAPYKNITIKMMERYYFGEFTNNSSTQTMLYHELVKDYYAMFLRLSPNIVISSSQPHRVYDYLIKQFCLVHHIEFVAYEHTGIRFLSYFQSSFENNFPYRKRHKKALPISNELSEFIKNTKSSSYDDVKPYNTSSFGMAQRDKKKYISYLDNFLKKLYKFRVNLLLKRVVGRFIVYSHDASLYVKYSYLIGMLLQKIKKTLSLNLLCIPYYNFFAKKNIYNKVDYVYFSPNYQPERSTVPDGRVFWDFCLAIDVLHGALPRGWKILYKEHPRVFRRNTDWDIDRDIFFYHRLRLKYPNLLFVSKDENVLNLIDSSKAVASVSGTVNTESAIRGKLTLFFGEPMLKNMPGVIQINNPTDCYEILDKINFKNISDVDKEDVSVYFSELESSCINLSSYIRYMSVIRSNRAQINEKGNNNLFNMDEIINNLIQSIIEAIEEGSYLK